MEKEKKSKPTGLKITLGQMTFSSKDATKRVATHSKSTTEASKRPKHSGDASPSVMCDTVTPLEPIRKERTGKNYLNLKLKPDAINRPLWVLSDGRILFETFSAIYKQAYDFLIAVAEPQSRPETIHEYQLTPHSLYAAVSVGIETETIIKILEKLSKVYLTDDIKDFIKKSTENYGKVKLVLKHNTFFMESKNTELLKELMKDDVVHDCIDGTTLMSTSAFKDQAAADLTREDVFDAQPSEAVVEVEPSTEQLPAPETTETEQAHAFKIKPAEVKSDKQRNNKRHMPFILTARAICVST